MAGHSKWSNIKRKKAKVDAERGKIFTKIAKEISVAAREGGGDPAANFRLNAAIQKAREANMPNDNIERAIKKGTGELEGVNYETVVYEGYGPEGTAVLCNVLTDNRNRTAGEIRYLFSRYNGNLGESGCVSWMFERKGMLVVDLEETGQEEEDILLMAIDHGAEDVKSEEGILEIYTEVESFKDVKDNLEKEGIEISNAEITMVPQNNVEISELDTARTMVNLMDMLEDHDDVQEVYSNYDIPGEILSKIE
ncbi:MAG: YebC/PmpR family DNA-binding transcriptional regulator [Clostridia bacterium]|nr:YebC/PmpR family DNA-binding transcriptional regulator [Clostridia bacterium]